MDDETKSNIIIFFLEILLVLFTGGFYILVKCYVWWCYHKEKKEHKEWRMCISECDKAALWQAVCEIERERKTS